MNFPKILKTQNKTAHKLCHFMSLVASRPSSLLSYGRARGIYLEVSMSAFILSVLDLIQDQAQDEMKLLDVDQEEGDYV